CVTYCRELEVWCEELKWLLFRRPRRFEPRLEVNARIREHGHRHGQHVLDGTVSQRDGERPLIDHQGDRVTGFSARQTSAVIAPEGDQSVTIDQGKFELTHAVEVAAIVSDAPLHEEQLRNLRAYGREPKNVV